MKILKLSIGVIAFWGLHSVAQSKITSVPGEFLIKFKQAYPLEQVLKDPQQFGINLLDLGQVKDTINELNVISVQRGVVESENSVLNRISSLPYVEYIEPNYIYKAVDIPNDPEIEKLWGLRNFGQKIAPGSVGVAGMDIGAEKAWDIQTGSKKIVVGIIDTGINYNDPNLKNNMWINEQELNGKEGVDDDQNGYVDDIHGYNFISGSKNTDPMDDNKHGSHCAGTIGASGNDGLGIVGVNWNVSMMALKFLDASGSGGAEDATKAILYAIKMHVNVLSNSWGGFGESKTILEAVKKANEAGIIFIAAAGNDSVNIDDYKFFPAGFAVPNVLPVAAIDNQGVLAYFSNWSDKLAMIGAPGKDIYSTTLDGLGYLSGTSMATPHVAGVAALVLAQYPNLSVKELVDRLTLTAQPIEGLYRKTRYGLVNAYSALTNTLSSQPPFDPHYWNHKNTVIETPHPYKNNSNLEWTISIPEAKEIAIYFDKIDVEADRDTVVIRKANGDYIEFVKSQAKNYYSMNIKDNNVKVVFTSSPGTRQYGFKISHVAWR